MHTEINKMRSISEDISQYGFVRRVWLCMTRKLPPSLSHLDELNWEILIVTGDDVTDYFAIVCSGGKIIASTALIELHSSDVELATMLAHEVAHIMARHGVEMCTKNCVSSTLNQRSFSLTIYKCEFEADYIGLLLMAAAGYDPRQAPKFYEKMTMFDEPVKFPLLARFLDSHPSSKERAKAVARPEIMQEALILYKDARGRRGVE
ncbi:putative peptidase M48 [Medicago truncatula]|uniref:Putative peptidase M48 n=1 Tax=Medicago truncatula TaxID=3880 RepID=A0A396JNN3_MEDTR|nr:putative peptidase M48 [Medicago truncatula]